MKQKNWFERNWKWLVPTGCLTMLLIVGLFIGSIFYGVNSLFSNSGPFKDSIELVNKNPEAISLLGKDIQKEGMMISGSISTSGSSGEADFSIPVKGNKGKGTIYVIAYKKAGKWNYELLELEVKKSGERINLLQNNTSEKGSVSF